MRKAEKKVKNTTRLFKLLEDEEYNIRELAERMYGSPDEIHRCHIRAGLSHLRKKGFPYYSQGANGIVKIPSNVEEWRRTSQMDYNRKRGGLMMYMRLMRRAILENPKLGDELLPLLNDLIVIASMGQIKKLLGKKQIKKQIKKLYGNKTNKPKEVKGEQKATEDRNKAGRHQSVEARSKTAKARSK